MENKEVWDVLYKNINLATFDKEIDDGYGEIKDAAIAVKNGYISWIGKPKDLPKNDTKKEIDAKGRWAFPGFIDCHTHIVYGGNRSNEFEARLNGVSYEEIAKSGGGIASTVNATRNISEDRLFDESIVRVKSLMNEGVTTLEIKSGYGLDLETEKKMLRVAKKIECSLPIKIKKTYLGAHAIPPEYKGRADDYIGFVCNKVLPELYSEGLIDAVDAFCENIGFSYKQCDKVFSVASGLGIPVKLHAEQLSDQGGTSLVAKYKGLSADHLEYLSIDSIKEMKKAGTVAVLLPGAFYYLRETKLPPIDILREEGVPMAVSTDCNPGTSPISSILLMLNMSCTLFRLTPQEALKGITVNAAKALSEEEAGVLKVGNIANMSLWKIDKPADLCYLIGGIETPERIFYRNICL